MRYIKKHWLHILLLVALFTSFTIPALADMPVIQPAVAGAGLWEVDGAETQLITADDIDMQTQKIINLVDPAANQDAATKKYVDDAIDTDVTAHSGLDTGVHGAGGDTLATDADIATHAALDTGVHGAGGDTLATDADITTHAALDTGVHGAGGDTLATDADIDADIATHAADIDAHYAMTGATFPASPVDGMLFTHEVTGRKILYVYDAENTAWVAIEAIGTMTLYVDKTDGSDSLEDHGTGVDGDAFATIQYAVDCIPALFSGDVTIYINDEAYTPASAVTIRGKVPSGDYTITLKGTLTELTSGTQSVNGVTGTGGTQGSFTDTGDLHATDYDDKLCYLDSDGENGYRIIDDCTVDTATIVGTFASQPLQNENYVIYDWGTSINNIVVEAGQKAVVVEDISITTKIATFSQAKVTLTRCKGVWGDFEFATQVINESYFVRSSSYVIDDVGGFTSMYRSKIDSTSDTGIGAYIRDNAIFWFMYGGIIDGYVDVVTRATQGIYCLRGAVANLYTATGNGYVRIRKCDTGVQAFQGAMVIQTSNVQYSGNGADEVDDAGEPYGYVD